VKVRLNYAVSDQVAALLEDYCLETGRKATDVVRQVVTDYISLETALPTVAAESGNSRADVWLHTSVADAFEKRYQVENHPTKSALISYLLSDFLSTRVSNDPTISYVVSIPRSVAKLLASYSDPSKLVADLIVANIQTFQQEVVNCGRA
jgi:hypothetical protein